MLAHLLFGRNLTSLSPLQAVQLANAVATLAGRGGDGVIGKLRRSFGLDDLDIETDAAGGASVRLGRYIAKNIYTDVTVGSEGTTELNLNLDVRPGVTVRGSADSQGNTGIRCIRRERRLLIDFAARHHRVQRCPQQHRVGAEPEPHHQHDDGTDGPVDVVVVVEIAEIEDETARNCGPEQGGQDQPRNDAGA